MKLNTLFIGIISGLAFCIVTLTLVVGYVQSTKARLSETSTPGSQLMEEAPQPEIFQQDTDAVCETSFTLPSLTFSCLGTIPPNSTLCIGDNTDLTSDTPNTLVSQCTETAKCQYICANGFAKTGDTCIPQTYSCTGTIPPNSTLCTGDETGLTVNTPRTLVGQCTTTTKCEYTCNSGYTQSGSTCTQQTYSCIGETPSNTTLCSGDDSNLTSNTSKTVVSQCTDDAKCQYTCNSGYVKSGNTCLLQRCYDRCDTNSECPSSLSCQTINGVKRCVNSSCSDSSTCTCPTPTPTTTASPSPSPTASPTAPASPELPKAGGIPPTILFTIGGIVLVAIGLLF